MIITINNVCENCCYQFINDHKYCEYCGSLLVDRRVEIPLRVLEIIIGYIKYDRRASFNRDIFSLSLVCADLFNATYCENSMILRKIYPKLNFRKIDKIYNLQYIESYFNFFYMLKKYFGDLNDRHFEKKTCFSKSVMQDVPRNDDILEKITNKKLTIVKNKYPNSFQINMSIYDIFNNFLKISQYIYGSNLNNEYDYFLDRIDNEKIRYYYTIPHIKCNNCSNKEYFPDKIMSISSYDIPYCDYCIMDKCKTCELLTYIVAYECFDRYSLQLNGIRKYHLTLNHSFVKQQRLRKYCKEIYIKDCDHYVDKYMNIQNHIESCSICQ